MRLRQMLSAKIHRATVTEADVNYVGSITIDQSLLERVDLLPGELVHVWNVTNGERFETYALAGEPGSRPGPHQRRGRPQGPPRRHRHRRRLRAHRRTRDCPR